MEDTLAFMASQGSAKMPRPDLFESGPRGASLMADHGVGALLRSAPQPHRRAGGKNNQPPIFLNRCRSGSTTTNALFSSVSW